jgi:inner membrane protein
MASVGHIAIGMAAARAYGGEGRVPRWSSMALWSAVSLLPDADVIGFALGVQYSDPWGHRGATHSLSLSVAVGLGIGLAARRFNRPALRTAVFASVVLASHAVLDTMTDGGLGCALLWPFSLTRYFAPWRPIPVAPIGLAFFSPYGGIIALTELVLFSPALLFALRSRGAHAKPVVVGFLLALWLASVWLITSGDPVREGIVGFVLREDTAYASGFSERAFRSITPGTSDQEVRRLLGAPLGESWFYAPKDQPFQSAVTRSASAAPHECLGIRFEAGVVATALERDACKARGIETGMSLVAVERLLGLPPESCWRYSWSPGNRHHRMRVVCFLNARVETVFRRWN